MATRMIKWAHPNTPKAYSIGPVLRCTLTNSVGISNSDVHSGCSTLHVVNAMVPGICSSRTSCAM